MSADNLVIWHALGRTDPKHTKAFKRAGGFSGTAVKPIYAVQKMTEAFGPCGIGWGMTEPVFQTVPGPEGEVLVFCTVGMWHGDRLNLVYGVGGDKAVGKNKYGLSTDDEAFKKAYTDALTNAMKHIGMAADVHMGQFDDSKYVRELEAEFAGGGAGADTAPKRGNGQSFGGPLTKTELKQKMRAFAGDLAACDDYDTLVGLLNKSQAVIDQCIRDMPDWYYGQGDAPGAMQSIEARKKELAVVADDPNNPDNLRMAG